MMASRSERALGVILPWTVAVSAVLVGAGFVAAFFVGWNGSIDGGATIDGSATSFVDLPQRLLELQPLAVTQLGLLVLIATPFVRLALTTLDFWQKRDRLYAGLGALILAILLLGLVLLR